MLLMRYYVLIIEWSSFIVTYFYMRPVMEFKKDLINTDYNLECEVDDYES